MNEKITEIDSTLNDSISKAESMLTDRIDKIDFPGIFQHLADKEESKHRFFLIDEADKFIASEVETGFKYIKAFPQP